MIALCAAAIVPLIYFGMMKPWTWGVMDEPGIVFSAREFKSGDPSTRRNVLFPKEMVHEEGRLRPLYFPYIRGRFIIFDSATAQHRIQVLLILITVAAWCRVAKLHGVKVVGIVMGALLTLYFGPFSIAGVSLLSIQELPGILLFSFAALSAIEAKRRGNSFLLGVALTLATGAVLVKETMFCLLPVIVIFLSERPLRVPEKIFLGVMITACVIFPLYLLTDVRGAYSRPYRLDITNITTNFFLGLIHLANTFKFGFVFVILGIIYKAVRGRITRFDIACAMGALLYFLILTPWTSDISYYHGPLGPFLGFLAGRGVEELFESGHDSTPLWAISLAIVLSGGAVFSVWKNVRRVYLFNDGLREVRAYLAENLRNEPVYVNGDEAAGSIPQGMTLDHGKEFHRFIFATPSTVVRGPAYLVINLHQERYFPPTVPTTAKKVLDHPWWQIFQLS
jgi:hypothetical protein